MKLFARLLFLFSLAIMGAVSLADQSPAEAQQQPCQWNYTIVNNQAVATYCGIVQAAGGITPIAVTSIAAMQALPSPFVDEVVIVAGTQGGTFIFSATTCNVGGLGDGGTQFPPTIGSGCWFRQYTGAPELAFWGLAQSNTAAQNTTALNAATVAPYAGAFSCQSGIFNFNGPVQFTQNYPACDGTATEFHIANCANGFIFGFGPYGTPTQQATGLHPANFKVSPSCNTTIDLGGTAITLQGMNFASSADNLCACTDGPTPLGGLGFYLTADAGVQMTNLHAELINGMCESLNSDPTVDTMAGFVGSFYADKCTDIGFMFDPGTIQGPATLYVKATANNGGSGGNGQQIFIKSGNGVFLTAEVEDPPQVSTGHYEVKVGNDNGGGSSYVNNSVINVQEGSPSGLTTVAICDLEASQGTTMDCANQTNSGTDAGSVWERVSSNGNYDTLVNAPTLPGTAVIQNNCVATMCTVAAGPPSNSIQRNGTWTPVDASGAALAFTSVSANYTVIGNMVHAYFSLTYPTTSNGLSAVIGGLPYTVSNHSYASQGILSYSNIATLKYIPASANTTNFSLQGASTPVTNATMSGGSINGEIVYPLN